MGAKLESYTDEHGNIIRDNDRVTLNGQDYRVAYISHLYVNLDGGKYNWLHHPFSKGIPNLKGSVKPTGPVRTVTRKEIVPGEYGCVKVQAVDDGGMAQVFLINPCGLATWLTSSELRAATNAHAMKEDD